MATTAQTTPIMVKNRDLIEKTVLKLKDSELFELIDIYIKYNSLVKYTVDGWEAIIIASLKYKK